MSLSPISIVLGQDNIEVLGYTDARAYNNNGVDFICKGQYQEASEEFKKALVIDPDFLVARYNLALAYYNLGKVKEAIAEFEYLINSSYYFVNAHYNLGTIYLREGLIEKAVEQLKIVVELDPNHAEAYFNLGYIYYKKAMLGDAIMEYQKGLKIKPDTLKGRLSLAFMYEKKELYKEAFDEYQAALDIKPDSQEARQAMGGLQSVIGIKKMSENNPADAQSYIHLGHIYYARGLYEEAADYYNKALQCDPENQAAKKSLEKSEAQGARCPSGEAKE